MRDLSQKGYSHEEVQAMLHGLYGSRQIRFRYDVLDSEENKKAELQEVISGSVDMSAFSNIKRTAKFSLRDETYITEDYMTWESVADKDWSDL